MDSRIMNVRLAAAAKWFRDQAESGLSKKKWCEQNGIARSKFYYYQHIFQQRVLDQNPAIIHAAGQALAPSFVEIAMPACVPDQVEPQSEPVSRVSVSEETIRITYGGFEIHISGEFSEQTLITALRAVKHAD